MRVIFDTTGVPAVEVSALVRVPKTLVDVDSLREDLTIPNPAFWKARTHGHATKGIDPELRLYREDKKSIYVPRHYDWTSQPRAPLFVTLDKRPRRRRKVEQGHSITLRDKIQREASAALLKNEEDKIICLACGKGKTVVSLHAASEGDRFPLLIVVHTNALKDQWRENYDDEGNLIGGIMRFYGLEREEIGIVQAGDEDWRGKKVAIAMLHTLVRKRFDPEFYAYWRLVIFDECHRIGAETFSRAASMFPCERWGLSATLQRDDGMDKVIQLHLGEVVYEYLEQDRKPTVYMVDTGISTDLGRFMMRGGRVNLGRLQTWLSEHPRRNEMIKSWLCRAMDHGRTILSLGERRTQLFDLAEYMNENYPDRAAVHVGQMPKEVRAAALKKDCVLATQHLAKEGLDRPKFDTLFIFIPFSGGRRGGRVRQSIGRILRDAEGKKDPKVFVFVDSISIIQAMTNKMLRALRLLGYKVKRVTRDVGRRSR